MSKLIKFSGITDNGNTEFLQDNFCMKVTFPKTGLLALMVLIAEGQTKVSYRIANNVSADADCDQIFSDWLRGETADKSDNVESELRGIVYANHNIVAIGQPIMFAKGMEGVLLRQGADKKLYVVSRYTNYFPSTELKERLVSDFSAANSEAEKILNSMKDDLRLFKELDQTDALTKAVREFQDQRAAITLNGFKIAALNTPHLSGLVNTDFTSLDGKEIEQAFKNTNLSFKKYFKNGFEAGAENSSLNDEADLNVAGKTAEELAKIAGETKVDPKKELQKEAA